MGALLEVNPVYTWCMPQPRSTAQVGPPPPKFTRALAPTLSPAPPFARFAAPAVDPAAPTPAWMLEGCARQCGAQVLGRRRGRMQAPCGRHTF